MSDIDERIEGGGGGEALGREGLSLSVCISLCVPLCVCKCV